MGYTGAPPNRTVASNHVDPGKASEIPVTNSGFIDFKGCEKMRLLTVARDE